MASRGQQVKIRYIYVTSAGKQVVPINLSLGQRTTLNYYNLVGQFWEMFWSEVESQTSSGKDDVMVISKRVW